MLGYITSLCGQTVVNSLEIKVEEVGYKQRKYIAPFVSVFVRVGLRFYH